MITIGLLGLWLIKRHMPDYRDPAVAPLDRWGFLLFGSGIALLSYALEIFGEHRLPPLTVATAVAPLPPPLVMLTLGALV